jgi:hypothetical protein
VVILEACAPVGTEAWSGRLGNYKKKGASGDLHENKATRQIFNVAPLELPRQLAERPQRLRKNLNMKDTLKMSMKTKNRMFKILPFRGYNRRFQGRACR